MKLLQRAHHGATLIIKQAAVPDLRVAVVNAVRVWSDARGKMHFEYLAARARGHPEPARRCGAPQTRYGDVRACERDPSLLNMLAVGRGTARGDAGMKPK